MDDGWVRSWLERAVPWARRAGRGIVTLTIAGALLAGGYAALLRSVERDEPTESAVTGQLPKQAIPVPQRPEYEFPYRTRIETTDRGQPRTRRAPRRQHRVAVGSLFPSPPTVAVAPPVRRSPPRHADGTASARGDKERRAPRRENHAMTPEIACIGSGTQPEATSAPSSSSSFVPLYHLFDPDTGDHCFALNEADARSTRAAGYEDLELLGQLFKEFAVGRDRVFVHGHTLGYVSSTRRFDTVALYRLWGSDGETVLTTTPERLGPDYHSPRKLGYILR